MVVSPEDEILSPVKINGEIDIYEIEPIRVDECRKKFPVKNDRLVDFYKELL